MKEALYIIFGWLLGLLSQPIVSRIERHHKRNDLKIAISSELKNLKVRLAGLCYQIEMHLGIGKKSTLKWVKSVYEKYRDDCPKSVLETITKLLETPDAKFDLAVSLFKAKENVILDLKTYSLSFIDSILEHLSVFDSEFQRAVLEVRTQMDMLNEEIKNTEFYLQLTFSPDAMKTNQGIIRTNLRDCYNNIQKGCRTVVNRIDKVLKD